MADRAEALTQISRLLGDVHLREVTPAQVREAVSRSLSHLADGLIAETAASDDVLDHDSAVAYLDQRLAFLGELIDPGDRDRLRTDLIRRIDQW